MKKILLFLSLFLMFLLGAKGMDATSCEREEIGVESVLQGKMPEGYTSMRRTVAVSLLSMGEFG